jgi:hypothetical protein
VNIINDDVGALTGTPLKLGQGAGLALNNLVWATWNNAVNINADDGNPFFNNVSGKHGTAPTDLLQTIGNANYQTNATLGSATALSSATLQQAKLLFDNQIDPNGNPLGLDTELPILLFPPDLWVTATELVDPSAMGLVYGGSTAAKQPNINLWKGRMKPVMSRYLNKTITTRLSQPGSTMAVATVSGSTTAWYVCFNPAALAAIEVAFLQGQDAPTVQMASQDFQFDRLGMSMRGIFDFGCNLQNYRGAVKMLGA